MDEGRLLNQIETYARHMMAASSFHFPYHNLEHTLNVVLHAGILINHYHLSEKDSFIVLAAAWFHDLGHLKGMLQGHEETSAEMMRAFLSDEVSDAGLVDAIGACILATRFPTSPKTLPEEILCDADTWHLGTPYFNQTDRLVKNEMEQRLGKQLLSWHELTLQFLQKHRYYTNYCRELLEPGKQENIRLLEYWSKRD